MLTTAGIVMKDAGIIRRTGTASLSWLLRSPRPCEKNSRLTGGIT